MPISQWIEHGGIGFTLLSVKYQHTKTSKTLDLDLSLRLSLMFGIKSSWWAKKYMHTELYMGPIEVKVTWHDFNHERHYI